MASSEHTSSRSGLGWLPKLILWVVVIGFGYLYLSSIDREDEQSSSLLESVVKLSPIPISALPGMPKTEEAAVTPPETQEKVAESADAEPVSDAESAVLAKPLIKQEPASQETIAEQPVATDSAPVATTEQSAPVAAAPQQLATAQPAPESAPAPSSPSPTQTVPSATPPPQQAATDQATHQDLSTPLHTDAVQTQTQRDANAAIDQWRAMQQQQHEQMVAHYAAMRREADERMREYWARMRSVAPNVPYYGYPAQGPGYGPGYAPGVYAPPR